MSIKRKKFNNFINRKIILSCRFDSYQDLCNSSWNQNDSFCVGSDQVWNWDFTGDNEAYVLNFAPKDAIKFSYAASVGRELDLNHIERLKGNIRDFTGISIRESSTCDILRKNGICCRQDIDPIFLLSRTEWEHVSVPVKNEETPFVLIYLLQKAPNLLREAVEYAKKKRMRVVFISTGLKREIQGEYVVTSGPDEFIRYFLKANTIFTNSFHGVSFSILFNKPFYFELLQDGAKTNSRLQDITEMFNLASRNISNASLNDQPIDYDRINTAIQEKKNEAFCYLKSQILIGEDRLRSEENSVDNQDI